MKLFETISAFRIVFWRYLAKSCSRINNRSAARLVFIFAAAIQVFATRPLAAASLLATVTPVHQFLDDTAPDPQARGGTPEGGVVQGTDGMLYGTTSQGGSYGHGTVFVVSPSGAYKVLHEFSATSSSDSFYNLDGFSPNGSLVQGSDGAFYGTTGDGGTGECGVIFRITAEGVFSVVHAFDGPDGNSPNGGLVFGPDGRLYGTCGFGGQGEGTIFAVDVAGNFETLHTFDDDSVYSKRNSGGAAPYCGLTLGSDGIFYGLTDEGGAAGSGVLFSISAAGEFRSLHDFDGSIDGAYPETALVQASDGLLYGATTMSYGDGLFSGTFFSATHDGQVNVLHRFKGQNANGFPEAYYLIQAQDGYFYGTGGAGSDHGAGLLFRLNARGDYLELHDFDYLDGGPGINDVTQVADGSFYGTARNGGENGTGLVFRAVLAAPDFGNVNPPVGRSLQAYSYQIPITNAPAAFAASGLPPGLAIDATSGIVSGIPSQAGDYQVSLTATNSVGSDIEVITFTVLPGLPMVTLTAPVNTAILNSGQTGEFLLTIPSLLTTDLHINYTIKGTATNGTDYTLLKSTKKLKAGKLQKLIKITPQGDLGGAKKKTVILVLEPGDGYMVGTTDKVKVKLLTP